MLLLPGLFTPIVAILMAILQVWAGLSRQFPPQGGEDWVHILLAALAASVAMLGPGASSIDARRFGRKVFDIVHRGHDADYTL
jgi:uncharacterized membrane protein YphA (DoxX/SURF4 family)